MGTFLKINGGTLESIKSQYKNDPSDCLQEMIKIWLKQNEPLPTWEDLVRVLHSASISESEVGTRIHNKYCPHMTQQPSPSKYFHTIYYTRRRMHGIFGEREQANMEEACLPSSLMGRHASCPQMCIVSVAKCSLASAQLSHTVGVDKYEPRSVRRI